MRRRRAIEVWPAFADLMTILSVPGLFLAMSVLGMVGEDFKSVEDLARQNRELRKENEARARNEAMFQAIQKVQGIIDGMAEQGDLQFSADQTLQFGDDLVTFDLNSVSVTWKAGGQTRLRRFCESLRQQLKSSSFDTTELGRLFQIEVEGHTDSTICVADPNCNWAFSNRRAVTFMNLTHDEALCPGGSALSLKPVGYADTKPEAEPGSGIRRATRRIALRIVPNYQAIIAEADRAAAQASAEGQIDR